MTDALAVGKGTLDVIVLRALAGETMHGFEIVDWIERSTDDAMDITDAAVYQALYRMERRKLIKGHWAMSEKQRRARYYELTATGRRHLAAETRRWIRYADTVTRLLTGTAVREGV